jgi:NTP pyrophosphatase (non-canonical NTP hydrolase)
MEIPTYPDEIDDEPLTFAEYQRRSQASAVYPFAGQMINYVYPILGMCGETGEVAEKLKKIMRDKHGIIDDEDRRQLTKELGDVLWYIAATARELGLTMEEVAATNLEKVDGRRTRGTLRGSGDDR